MKVLTFIHLVVKLGQLAVLICLLILFSVFAYLVLETFL